MLCGGIVYSAWIKRVLDIVVATGVLILISPMLLLLAVLVRCILGTPVLFSQQRPGRHGVPFTLYKLRTMTGTRDAAGNLLPDSQRLTSFGRFLRGSSMDELPELINVIKGEMSLVGPRPLLMRYYPFFTEAEKVRFSVRPGITGLAQVSGRNDLSWDSRIAADIEYVQTCSFWLDVEIIIKTGLAVFVRHGFQADPGATMLDFDEERRRRASGSIDTMH
jgi:lipopolysaccharide/colanic/teichoic acid biosynthesis glycosyltransferase